MVSIKKTLFASAVAVALATIAVHGESYEAKRLLRHEAMEVAEAEEADDSECGSLEMAEEESSKNNNNWSDTTQTTQSPTTQAPGANAWTDGGNTWTSGGSTTTTGTNTWDTTNTGTTDQTQFTQGQIGGEAETSNINFNSFQNPNNVGTVSSQ